MRGSSEEPRKTSITCSEEQNEEQKVGFQTNKTVLLIEVGLEALSLQWTSQIMEVGVRKVLYNIVVKIRGEWHWALPPSIVIF